MKEIKVKLTFLEEVLGTASADKEIHDTFIASKAPDSPSRKEEIEALGVEEVIEKSMTVFPRKLPETTKSTDGTGRTCGAGKQRNRSGRKHD